MKCTQCGAEIIEGAAFCRYCGFKVDSSSEKNFCPFCGETLTPGASFCRKCGRRLGIKEHLSEDCDKIDEVEPPNRNDESSTKRAGFWNRLDGFIKGCIIIGGFLSYLLILSCVAHKGLGIVICIFQLVLLSVLIADHYGKLQTKWRVKPAVIAAVLLLSLAYLYCFHIPNTDNSEANTSILKTSQEQGEADSTDLFYTTNKKDTYKNGNTGSYAYSMNDEETCLYFIFDFDSKSIYVFSDSSDNGCIRYPLKSGDLNSGIAFTVNSDGTSTDVIARFQEKKQPESLVIQSDTQESAILKPANIFKALQMKEQKIIVPAESIFPSVSDFTKEPSSATTESVSLADNEIKIDFSPYTLTGENYEAVGVKLTQKGFTNIEYKIVYDIIWGITEEGSVKSVTIAGLENFSKGDIFKSDDPVVITYHMMQKDDPNRPVETTAPTTQRPEEDNSVSFSTNTKDTYKNGNAGIYAYKSYGERYDNYWIIDFDEGYVYSFTDGLDDNSCAKLAIESGDLNSTLTFSFHEDGKAYQWCAFFKWKRQPDHLVIVDDDNFDYDYYSVDLSKALQIRNQKEISLR